MKLIFSDFWIARGARLAGSIVSCVALLSGNVQADDGELSYSLNSDDKSAKSESSEFARSRTRFVSQRADADAGDAEADAAEAVSVVVRIVKEIREGLNAAESSTTIQERIRLATWELLLGEYAAAHPELSLPSTAIDIINAGKERLAGIEAEIAANPDLEDEISEEPAVAVRLDTARVRSVLYQQRQDLSRVDEVARLNQLRGLVRTYRDLTESLLYWGVNRSIGDVRGVEDLASSSIADLKAIYGVVDERRDYHLFDNEPRVDDREDYKVVEVLPDPYSDSAVSAMRAIQGTAYLPHIETAATVDSEFLVNAEAWANASLGRGAAPGGDAIGADGDPNNILALWVLASVEERRGDLLAFSADEAERRQGKLHFENAREAISQMLAACDEKKVPVDALIRLTATRRQRELETAEPLVLQAAEQEQLSQPVMAKQLLLMAARRQFDAAPGIESLRVGVRDGTSADELLADYQRYVDIGLIDPASIDARCLHAELQAYRVTALLADNDGQLEMPTAEQIAGAVRAAAEQLAPVCVDPAQTEVRRAEAKAAYALCVALSAVIDPASQEKATLEVAFNHAQDARVTLAQTLLQESAHFQDEQRARWSLVSALVAGGHLTATVNEDWRDDSRILFTLAAEEASKLADSRSVNLMVASPLLRNVLAASPTQDGWLAAAERNKRQYAAAFLRAFYSAEFSGPSVGGDALQEVVDLVPPLSAVGEGWASLDLSKLADQADGFDEVADLSLEIKSLCALAEVRHGQTEAALEILAAAVGSKSSQGDRKSVVATQQNAQALSDQIAEIDSPMLAFAAAVALDAYLERLPLFTAVPVRQKFIDSAIGASMQAEKLMSPERNRSKFAAMSEAVRYVRNRLEDAQLSITAFRELEKSSGVDVALAEARRGIARHPQNLELWVNYLRLRSRTILFGGLADDAVDELLAEMDAARTAGVLPDFGYHFGRAELLEGAGRIDDAIREYLVALPFAKDGALRVKALSKAAQLKARS